MGGGGGGTETQREKEIKKERKKEREKERKKRIPNPVPSIRLTPSLHRSTFDWSVLTQSSDRPICEYLLNLAMEETDAGRGFLYLFDRELGTLAMALECKGRGGEFTAYESDKSSIDAQSHGFGAPLSSARVAKDRGVAVNIVDAYCDSRFDHRLEQPGLGGADRTMSIVSVPIGGAGLECFGVLQVMDKGKTAQVTSVRHFSRADETVLHRIANFAQTVLQNSHDHRESQEAYEKMREMVHLSALISSVSLTHCRVPVSAPLPPSPLSPPPS